MATKKTTRKAKGAFVAPNIEELQAAQAEQEARLAATRELVKKANAYNDGAEKIEGAKAALALGRAVMAALPEEEGFFLSPELVCAVLNENAEALYTDVEPELAIAPDDAKVLDRALHDLQAELYPDA